MKPPFRYPSSWRAKPGANLDPGTELLNIRARAITLALHRGLINAFELGREEALLQHWLRSRH